MSFKRNRNVIALALANLKEPCQQVEKRTRSTDRPYKAVHISVVCGKGGEWVGQDEERQGGGSKGVELTDSQFDFITGI